MISKLLLQTTLAFAFVLPSLAQSSRGIATLNTQANKYPTANDSIAVTLTTSSWGRLDYDFDPSRGYELQALQLQAPIYGQKVDGFTWGVGLVAEYTEFSEKGPALLKNSDLYELGLALAIIGGQISDSPWSPALFIQGSLATDFHETENSFRTTVVGGAFYQQNPQLKWFFGATYLDQGPETRAFPVAGISWKPALDWEVTIMGPRLDLTYRHHDGLRLGVFADLYSRSWAVRGAANTVNSLEVFSARAGIRVDYQVLGKTWIFAETGATLANSIDFYNDQEQRIFSEDAEAGFFFNLGLRYFF